MHKTLHSLHMPAEQFGTHSLRIGSATAAAEAGISMKIIKLRGDGLVTATGDTYTLHITYSNT